MLLWGHAQDKREGLEAERTPAFSGPPRAHLWFEDDVVSDHRLPGEVGDQEKSQGGSQG